MGGRNQFLNVFGRVPPLRFFSPFSFVLHRLFPSLSLPRLSLHSAKRIHCCSVDFVPKLDTKSAVNLSFGFSAIS